MRISDWSSDVCSSDLEGSRPISRREQAQSQTLINRTRHRCPAVPYGGGPNRPTLQRYGPYFVQYGLARRESLFLGRHFVHTLFCTLCFHRLSALLGRVSRIVGSVDRKRVVFGLSVSVRDDLGGQRILKTTKQSESNTIVIGKR